MIGKTYEESLSWEAFNEESQELLTFLRGLMEEGQASDLFSKTKVDTSFFLRPF